MMADIELCECEVRARNVFIRTQASQSMHQRGGGEEEEEEEERSGSGDWLVLLLYMPNNKNGVRCCVLNI